LVLAPAGRGRAPGQETLVAAPARAVDARPPRGLRRCDLAGAPLRPGVVEPLLQGDALGRARPRPSLRQGAALDRLERQGGLDRLVHDVAVRRREQARPRAEPPPPSLEARDAHAPARPPCPAPRRP